MIYLLELIKGILFSFGVVLGFFILIIVALKRSKQTANYKADDLIEPFEEYLLELKEDERYEEIESVENIIKSLEIGKVLKEVNNYKIKKDTSFGLIEDKYGNESFRLIKKYTVLKMDK